METIVLIMVLMIYVGAISAPIAVYLLARKTGHGRGWLGAIGMCAAVVWLALFLGFLREFLDIEISRDVLEPVGFLALVGFATLGIIALVLVTRPWPQTANQANRSRFEPGSVGNLAADIE